MYSTDRGIRFGLPGPRRARLVAYFGLGAFGFIWGASIPLTKLAVSSGHSPFGLIFWQLSFSVVFLGGSIAIRKLPIRFTSQHLRYYIVIGLIGTLIPNSFSLLAASQLPAGIMAIAIATVPIFSLLIALCVGAEQFQLSRSVGVLLGVMALILIALPDRALPGSGGERWLLVALIAPLCYGVEGNYIALRAPHDVHPIAALFGASLIALMLLAPVTYAGDFGVNLLRPWSVAEWALLGSSVCHAIAYAGYMWVVGVAGAVFSSQIAYVVTASAIAMSIVFLEENYSAWVWAAILLMCLGLLMVQPIQRAHVTK